MGCNNLIVGSHVLHSVSKSYVKVFNYISTFVEPITPTNIIKNETILNQYIIKQGLEFRGGEGKAVVQK